MLSPKPHRQGQQQAIVDPYNSNLTLDQQQQQQTLVNKPNAFYRTQQYNKVQHRHLNEPQISVSQANLNQKNESNSFLASLGTLGRKKKQQQEGKFMQFYIT